MDPSGVRILSVGISYVQYLTILISNEVKISKDIVNPTGL